MSGQDSETYSLYNAFRQLDQLCQDITRIEKQMEKVFLPSEEMKLLMTAPGIGFILAVVISQEIGKVSRFAGPDRLVSYAGTAPRVHASGGKVRYGSLRPDTNRYLKWAFSEAGNSIAVNRDRLAYRHVSRLYKRIRTRRGHPQAIGAVARHLAAASYWMLSKKEAYREREIPSVSSTRA